MGMSNEFKSSFSFQTVLHKRPSMSSTKEARQINRPVSKTAKMFDIRLPSGEPKYSDFQRDLQD